MRKLRALVLEVDFTKAKVAAEGSDGKKEESAHDALHELMSLEVSLA